MANAKNASDAAASACRLWKATAKGNPDAPVQLADMIIGQGVPRSCERAVRHSEDRGGEGKRPHRNRLASMYATRKLVARSGASLIAG